MLLRTLCSGLRRCLIAGPPLTTTAASTAAASTTTTTATRALSGSSSSSSDGGGGIKPPPAHWDRSGGLASSANTSPASAVAVGNDSSSSTGASNPPPAGVAQATHMLLTPPVYNVLGDVVPVNEYHLAEEAPGGGGPFFTLPIVHLGARRNNCIATITDSKGRVLGITSTGVEGFANAKKSTTVAAQVVGVSIALKAKKLGIMQARLVLRGMNQLRLACLKGMASAGLQIVSITDNTKIHYGKGRRPRKPPRK